MNLFTSILFGILATIQGQLTEIPTNESNSKTPLPASITLPFTMKSAEQIAAEKRQEKLDALYSKIIEGFAGVDEKKKDYLRQPYDKNPEIGTCYLETYGTFLAQCCTIEHYDNLKKFKHLTSRICAAKWFEIDDTWKRMGEICDANQDLKI